VTGNLPLSKSSHVEVRQQECHGRSTGFWSGTHWIYILIQPCTMSILSKKKTKQNKPFLTQPCTMSILSKKKKQKNHGAPVRMAKIDKARNNKCWRGCGERGTLLHCWGVQVGTATLENSVEVPQKFNFLLIIHFHSLTECRLG